MATLGPTSGTQESKRAVYTLCPTPKTRLLPGKRASAKAQIPPEGRGVEKGALYHPSPQFCTRSRSRSGPAAPRPEGVACCAGHGPAQYKSHLGTGSPRAEAKPTLSVLFTKTRSSSPFCRARSRYIPTLLRHGGIDQALYKMSSLILTTFSQLHLLPFHRVIDPTLGSNVQEGLVHSTRHDHRGFQRMFVE